MVDHEAEPVTVVPATYVQEEWLRSVRNAVSRDNLVVAWKFTGQLDKGELRRALGAVAHRHETLRSALHSGDGCVEQWVRDSDTFEVPVRETPMLTNGDRDLVELAREDAGRPFTLTDAPLWRGLLVEMAPEHHVLVLVFHHSIFDGWSRDVLLRDVARSYGRGRPAGWEEAVGSEMQLGEYGAWERSANLPRSEAYWQGRLGTAASTPNLPSATGWHVGDGFVLARRPLDVLRARDVSRLRALASRCGTTLSVVLRAGILSSLAAYLGTDVVIGVLYRQRRTRQLKALVAPLIDHVPVRVDMRGTPSFVELIDRVDAASREARSHRIPLGRVRKCLEVAAGTRIFDVSVNYIPYAAEPRGRVLATEDARVAVSAFGLEVEPCRFDVNREFSFAVRLGYVLRGTAGDEITASLWANEGAVGPETLADISTRFRRLMRNVACEPENAIGSLETLE